MNKFIKLLLLVSLTGCGTLSRIRDEKKSKTDSTAVVTSTVKADVVTVTEEVIDTTVQLKADSAVVETPLNTLLDKGIIESTNNGTTVKVTYDKETGDIRAVGISAERSVPVNMSRKTTTTDKSNTETKSKVDVKKKEAIKNEQKTVEQKSKFWWGVAFAFGLILILIIIILLARQYIKKFI